MDSAAVKGVGVFGLCGVELVADAVDERIAKGVGGGEEDEVTFVANFLAEQNKSAEVEPSSTIGIGDGFDQLMGESIVGGVD